MGTITFFKFIFTLTFFTFFIWIQKFNDSQKFKWFLPLLCRIYTCHVTWHAAAASKCNFWEKNSNKSVKNQKREKKCQNLEQTLLKDNHKFNYKLQIIFAITNYDIAWMTIQIWFLARKSVLQILSGAHRPFKGLVESMPRRMKAVIKAKRVSN